MEKIDFLTNSSKSFIFKQNSNKTLFGGILSFIFLILILLIILFYLIGYFINDKYTIEYGYFQEILDSNKTKAYENSSKYNPIIEFGYVLQDEKEKAINNDTIILIDKNLQILPQVFSTPVSNLNYSILYKCADKNCTIDKIEGNYIKLILLFNGFQIDHQGDIPLYQRKKGIYYYTSNFYINNPSSRFYSWQIIKYIDNLGVIGFLYDLFGIDKNNEYFGGTISNSEFISLKDIIKESLEPFELNNTYYRLIGMGQMLMNFNDYHQYKRTKITIFDIIANITSLSVLIFSFFDFFLKKFYSSDYDNYKIVEKILSKINSRNINNKIDIKKEENVINRDSSQTQSLLNNSEEDNINIKKVDNTKENLIKENIDENGNILPKIKFIDFLKNNLYSCICFKSKPKTIISKCEELISNYYSMEYIIYNQMILENLLKDYKWNDMNLSKIETNKFIEQMINR